MRPAPALTHSLFPCLATFLTAGPAATPHSPAQHQGPQAPAPAASQRLSRTLSDAYSSAGDAAANRATLLREMAAKWAAFGALTAVAACGYPAPFLQLRMPSGATGQHGSHQGLCGPVALPLPPLLHRLALHAALFSGMAAMVGVRRGGPSSCNNNKTGLLVQLPAREASTIQANCGPGSKMSVF